MTDPTALTSPRTEPRWRAATRTSGWRSGSIATALMVLGLAWLTWPVWGSLTNPGRDDLVAAGPWLSLALVTGLVALAVAIWRDAGRRHETLSVVALLVLATTVLRAVLTPGAAGIEFVHALPLLAGVALGAPAGFLTGATSALVSTVLVGVTAETLPMQALIWGLVGASGGLFSLSRPTVAWLLAVPWAVAAGVGAGVLLNLMGWGVDPGVTETHFHPGLPPWESAQRLWNYTRTTSLAYDTTRGVTSALVVLLVGRPLLRALRPESSHARVTTPAVDDVAPEALARREDRVRLDRLWN